MVFGCKCCRCSKSIESLDLQKPPTEVINKREKLSQAQAKSYKKLRLSSFIPESYFVNGQQLNNQMNTASTSQVDALCLNEQTNIKKYQINQAIPSTSSHETKPKMLDKIAFKPIQQSIYEEEGTNEAETLIGPDNRTIIDKTNKMNSNRKKNLSKLEISNDDNIYNFDYNLYSIKKNISVWCIDIALLTSNGQTLKNLLNKGYHHLNFLFDPKPNDDLILPDDNISSTTSATFNNTFSNSTSFLSEDEELLRKRFGDLWSFYLFMFNLGLIISSIILQLLVGILLLLNTKSSKKKTNYPKGNAECYNHLILIIILLITVINVFIVIFVDEVT